MIRESVVGDVPQIENTAFVDPSAIIIGRVIIGAQCYIGPGVVIRSDRFSNNDQASRIVIGKNCSIQDLSVLHAHAGNSITIGNETIINHGVVIHGNSTIGSNCFIGAKSVITHATIGNNVLIRLMSVVEEVEIPPERCIEVNSVINEQDSVSRLRPLTVKEKEFMQHALLENREYAVRYKYSLGR
ncbi:MAG: hypothetical protein WCQ99_09070 [Pseudomonadota bacterium]